MAESLLALNDILVCHGDKTVLHIPHLEIESGEVLALLGPNGAGKTTLLRVMGLLQVPDAGALRFKGAAVRSADALAIRRRIANVFQEPLLLNTTVYQNAALGLKLRGFSRAAIQPKLNPWLDRLGIAHLAARSARTLSGGEAQRTSLARALALEPELLLLDEPFSALDPTTRSELWRDFQRIIKETGTTTVFVTHDRDEAFVLADRVAALADGDLLQIGSRDEIFARPASATVAELVGFDNRLVGRVEGQDGDQVEIALGDRKVLAKGQSTGFANVLVCIRAGNVSLGTESRNSMNRMRGRVLDIAAGVTRDRIVLDCGTFRLIAEVDRKNCPALALRVGDETAAAFDAASVHVIPGIDVNKCA